MTDAAGLCARRSSLEEAPDAYRELCKCGGGSAKERMHGEVEMVQGESKIRSGRRSGKTVWRL